MDFIRCGIWQIGAINFETKETFFEECRIDDQDEVVDKNKELFKIIGKTEEELRDTKKQSQREMLEKFFRWCSRSKVKNFMCENPQFDVAFLEIKARKYDLKFPFNYRAYDLHSIAQAKHLEVEGKFLIKDKCSAGLKHLIPFCGIKDERGFHNALEDARLTAECFSRVFYGKNFLEEYKKFPVPKYLQN